MANKLEPPAEDSKLAFVRDFIEKDADRYIESSAFDRHAAYVRREVVLCSLNNELGK